jgi:hypothetical protein
LGKPQPNCRICAVCVMKEGAEYVDVDLHPACKVTFLSTYVPSSGLSVVRNSICMDTEFHLQILLGLYVIWTGKIYLLSHFLNWLLTLYLCHLSGIKRNIHALLAFGVYEFTHFFLWPGKCELLLNMKFWCLSCNVLTGIMWLGSGLLDKLSFDAA